jgi:hypothetical protein
MNDHFVLASLIATHMLAYALGLSVGWLSEVWRNR